MANRELQGETIESDVASAVSEEGVFSSRKPQAFLKCFSFGPLLAWFWLAFGQGLCNPADNKGYLVVAVTVTLFAAGLFLLLISHFGQGSTKWASNKMLTLGSALVATVASLILGFASTGLLPQPVIWVASLIVGPCAAWLLLLCGKSYEDLTLKQIFFCVFGSVFVVFLVYFSVTGFPLSVQAILFSLLPILTALLLVFSPSATEGDSSAGAGTEAQVSSAGVADKPLASIGHLRMILSFGIYFFTISVVRSVSLSFSKKGMAGFADGVDIATVLIAVLVLTILFLNMQKDRSTPFVRVCYFVVAVVEIFTILPIAVAIEGTMSANAILLVRIVADVVFFMTVLIAWYCVAVDVNLRRLPSCKTFGFAWGIWALAAGSGWIFHNALERFITVPNAMLLFLAAHAIIRLTCFLFIFPDNALVKFISAPVLEKQTGESDGKSGKDDAHFLSFKEAVRKIGEETKLSEREQEILLMLAKNRSNQYIADELVLSFHTVRAHVRNVYAKLKIHNRQELLDLIERVQRQRIGE
jgi:DNA-binding CsgD family transcriptional regulator